MGLKKRIIEVPEWFSLEKYYGEDLRGGLQNFSPSDWFFEISKRLDFQKDGSLFHFKEEVLINSEKVEAFWQEPVRTLGTENSIDTEKLLWNSGAVKIAGVREFLRLSRIFKRRRSISPTELGYAPLEKIVKLDSQKDDYERYFGGFVNLIVNLEMSDDLLFESFKALIKLLRLKEPWCRNKQISFKNEMDNWATYGILPYWDLMAWEKNCLKKTNFTQEWFGNNIFPNGSYAPDYIRKNTSDRVEKVFTSDFLNAFLAHILLEEKKVLVKEMN